LKKSEALMETLTWKNLLIDAQAVLVPLDESRFRAWLSSQRVFISSVMDPELKPYRKAVRAFLEQYGTGVPVMWETISPADIGPVKAYLTGVDSSSLFVLMLGGRYGVATAGGYSPTHQEERHAKERHLLRLFFTLPPKDEAADGRLQDWKGSLYNEISGNYAASPQDLVSQLKAKLDQLAARAQRDWIKLGRCMFIGSVKTKSSPTAGQSFHVVAKARDMSVRHELHAMASQRRSVRLTSSKGSFRVQIEHVEESGELVGESDYEIVCQAARDQSDEGQQYNMIVNGVGPDETARQWAEHVIFGKPLPVDKTFGGLGMYGIRPDAPTLKSVLATTGAQGWQAEGLVRLYAIEEVARTRGGRFTDLSVGPATATGVRIDGTFVLPVQGMSPASVPLHGVIALKQ
jgi:hypothetical protein